MSRTKKIIIAVIAAAAALAIALTLVFITSKKQKPAENEEPIVTTDLSIPEATEQPSEIPITTTEPETTVIATAPSTQASTTEAPTQPATVPAPDHSGMSKAQIIQMFTDAVNQTKNHSGTITAHRRENFDAKVTQCTGGDVVANIVTRIFSAVIAPTDETMTFTGGTARNSAGKTVALLLPETGYASLPESGIESASIYYDGANTVIDLTLYPESAGLTDRPPVHAAGVGYLDASTLDLSVVQLTGFKFDYTGTTVHASINSVGNIVSVVYVIPVHVEGTGRLGIASGTAVVEGTETITWDVNW